MERALRKHLPDGAFSNVSATRSKAMAAVRGHGNKTTERRFRLALVRAGMRGWQVRPKGLRGNPDFVFPVSRIVVFVDGCFWHGCPKCGHVPRTNGSYWAAKLKRNRERDLRTTDQLEGEGFQVLRFWEHELKDSLEACIATVEAAASCRSMQGIPVLGEEQFANQNNVAQYRVLAVRRSWSKKGVGGRTIGSHNAL